MNNEPFETDPGLKHIQRNVALVTFFVIVLVLLLWLLVSRWPEFLALIQKIKETGTTLSEQ